MSRPLKESDILFPHLSNTPSFSTTISSLRRSALSIHNRLTSITSDSSFVTSVSVAYDLPLVANERCGSWYIPPDRKVEGVYFKSTDGHMGEWSFSLRRLNLQLLDVVAKHRGAIVVDSTRRGKSIPDALSKTVPIWCCVVNRVVFGEGEMYTPPQAVSKSEKAQIEGRIDGFVKQFLDICKPKIPELREKLRKPLRPIWVTQQSYLPESVPAFADFHPLILCTASRRVPGAEVSEGGYIQGAADDQEAWSYGMTPAIFWKNKDLLLATSEEDTPSIIRELLVQETAAGSSSSATLIKPSSTLYISPSDNIDLGVFDVIISCTPKPLPADALKTGKLKNYLHLKCQTGKLGSRDLRNQLSLLPGFFSSRPSSTRTTSPKILICCPTGKDLSVGAALATLCSYADDNGGLDFTRRRASVDMDKNMIKQRLSWITTSNPALNPSRSTLQSVNAALLTSQDPKTSSASLRPKHDVSLKDDITVPLSLRLNDSADESTHSSPSHHSPLSTCLFNTLSAHSWTFTRSLTSALPSHPSGTVTGTATFTPCALSAHFPSTLLYFEQGEFVTDGGFKMGIRRRYVYQLVKSPKTMEEGEEGEEERIIVKFFDDEKYPRISKIGEQGEGIGGVFVEMGAIASSSPSTSLTSNGQGGEGEEVYVAKNKERHLCGDDLYGASWKFGEGILDSKSEGEKWWEVRYEVKGPKKDYVSVTRYTI